MTVFHQAANPIRACYVFNQSTDWVRQICFHLKNHVKLVKGQRDVVFHIKKARQTSMEYSIVSAKSSSFSIAA